MDSRLLGRRLAAISGLSAIIAMGAITAACAKEEKAPETTTPTTTTTTTATSGAGAPPPLKRASTPRAETCSLRQFRRPRRQTSHPDNILVSTGFPRSLFGFRDAAPSMKQMAARYRLLAILAAGVLLLVAGVHAESMSDNRAVIGGPLALLLASSTDLGPSRDDSAQLTVTLPDSARPRDADRMGKHTPHPGAVAAGRRMGRRRGGRTGCGHRVRRAGERLPRSQGAGVLRVAAATVGSRAPSRRRHRARPNPGLHPAP